MGLQVMLRAGFQIALSSFIELRISCTREHVQSLRLQLL